MRKSPVNRKTALKSTLYRPARSRLAFLLVRFCSITISYIYIMPVRSLSKRSKSALALSKLLYYYYIIIIAITFTYRTLDRGQLVLWFKRKRNPFTSISITATNSS